MIKKNLHFHPSLFFITVQIYCCYIATILKKTNWGPERSSNLPTGHTGLLMWMERKAPSTGQYLSNKQNAFKPSSHLTIHHKTFKVRTWWWNSENKPQTGSCSVSLKKDQHWPLRISRVNNFKCRHEFVTKANNSQKKKEE